MERIIAERLEIEWSGYIRTSLITSEFAKLMVRSGVGDLEVAITSGSQEVLNGLHMGFVLDRLYDGDRKSTRLNSSHGYISYAVFCLKKKKRHTPTDSEL